MVKYICEKCGKVFSQKCHYDNHMNKKIPCNFKGNNINEIVEEKIIDTISNLNNEIKNSKIDLNLDLINTYKKMNTELNDIPSLDINQIKNRFGNDYKNYKNWLISNGLNKDNLKQKKYETLHKQAIKLINENNNNNNNNNEVVKEEFVKKHKSNVVVFENTEEHKMKIKNSEAFKNEFLNFLHEMHNLLRGAAVTGDKALDDILHCLCICYLEDKISDKGDYDLANSEKNCYKGIIQRKVKEYIKYLNIDYLLNNTAELRCKEGSNSIEKCGKVLSKHPITQQIFHNNEDFINCNDTNVLFKLLKECKNFSKKENIFNQIDIIGIAYEYIISKYGGNGGTSKEMGQYFTERPLMYMCFRLIEETDLQELEIDNNSTLGDEFCATLGFPLMAKKFLSEEHNITIEDKNIYGVEMHDRLSKFSYMNAMFSMTNFKNITQGNSFITNVSPHLDISVHNVPFGDSMIPENIKKTYEGFKNENNNKSYPNFEEYIPHNKKKIDTILSSQVVLYKTKKMGLMIIKDGEETSGKSNDKYRKWFSENCIIKKIMKIPSGSFSCTGTKTVCIYFIKKEGLMTENIQFVELSEDRNKITEVCNVTMNDMKQNNYSWCHNSYVEDEKLKNIVNKSKYNCKPIFNYIKEIKEKKQNSKKGKKEGLYPFYYCSILGNLYLDNYDFNQEGIIMNKTNGSGKAKVYLGNGKYNVGKTTLHFKSINEKIILTKYIYYYIKNNLNLFEKYYTGSNQKSIRFDDLKNILIPILPIEDQKKTIDKIINIEDEKNILINKINDLDNTILKTFEESYN